MLRVYSITIHHGGTEYTEKKKKSEKQSPTVLIRISAMGEFGEFGTSVSAVAGSSVVS